MTLPLIIPRSAFGWPVFVGQYADTNRGMVIHYDGSNQHLEKDLHGECVAYWKETRSLHIEGRGWSDIGYSYGACPHGYIFVGRGYGKKQAAQRADSGKIHEGNERWVSVTLMSGPSEHPTKKQINAVRFLRSKLQREHGMGNYVKPHHAFSNTSCPGEILSSLVADRAFSQPPDTSGYRTLRVIKPPMYGEDVKLAQELLNRHGAVLKVDGFYGPLTGKAVRTLKMANRMAHNTKLGSHMWDFLLGK